MEYGKIIAVTGLPGLFELVSSKNDGAIVRSLDDKTTRFVSSRIHNVSHLESIEVYTARDNVNLVEVFNAMDTSNAGLPDDKDAKAVKGYFEKVYPDLDFERVYNSDMKKMIKWYSVLKDNNVELKLTEIPEEEEELEEAVVEEPVKKEKAEKQPKAKKAAVETKAKEEKPAAKKAEKEQPKKKAATKAKKEESSDKKKETPKKKTAAKKPPKKK